MNSDLSQFVKILNFLEWPGFLVLKREEEQKVMAINSKLKSSPFLKAELKSNLELNNFLINLLGFKKEEASEFIEKFQPKLNLSGSSETFEIISDNQKFNFEYESLTHEGAILSFVMVYSTERFFQNKEDLDIDFFKKTFESLPIGVAINTVDTQEPIYVNKSFAQLYGWTLADIKDLTSFFEKVYPDPDYRREIQDMIMKDIESRDASRMQWKNLRITTKKGNKKVVNAHNIPLYDHNLMISTVTDVTKTFEIQEHLEKVKTRLNLAAKATSDAVWEWKLDEDELFWGDGYERLFGYEIKNNTVKKSFWQSKIHPQDREVFFESLQAALEDKSLDKWTFDYRFMNHEGSYASVRENVIIVRNDKREAISIVGALQDITKAWKRENHLILLEKLVNSTKDSILVARVKNTNFLDSEIVYTNASFKDLFGFDTTETYGKTLYDFYITEKNHDEFTQLEKDLNEWESLERELLCTTRNDVKFWNKLSITPIIDEEGWYSHWMIVNRNVNDVKNLREKNRLLNFTHKAFQSEDSMQNLLRTVFSKINEITNCNVCELWFIDAYTVDLKRYLSYKNGDFFELESDANFIDYKDFTYEILKSDDSKIVLHKRASNFDADGKIKLSYGIKIGSAENPLGVLILGFEDTNSREESLRSIFDEFSIQLANEISRKVSETEMNAFFDFIPSILCIAASNGTLKKVSKRACDYLGYTKQKLLSKPFIDLVKDEDKDIALELVRAAREQEGYHTKKIRIETKEAETLTIEWTAFSLKSSEDVFCIGRNVSNLKEK